MDGNPQAGATIHMKAIERKLLLSPLLLGMSQMMKQFVWICCVLLDDLSELIHQSDI